MVVSFPVPEVTVLQVGVDVKVVVHAVRLLRLQLFREVALQLFQLLPGEEVGLWEHHLEEKTKNSIEYNHCVFMHQTVLGA